MTEMILAPYDAMWRETGCWYRAMEDIRRTLRESVANLSPADLARSAGADTPTIARLICHIGLAEVAWITKYWRAEPIPEAWKTWFERGRLGADAAPLGQVSAAEIFVWLDEVREKTRLALIKVNDKELDRRTIKHRNGMASLRWILYHLVEHEAHHRGQICMIRRLLGVPLPSSH